MELRHGVVIMLSGVQHLIRQFKIIECLYNRGELDKLGPRTNYVYNDSLYPPHSNVQLGYAGPISHIFTTLQSRLSFSESFSLDFSAEANVVNVPHRTKDNPPSLSILHVSLLFSLIS
jgi:hypothetical protein